MRVERPGKQVGVGLQVAVLVDATVVRTVLLPAATVMLGEHNWYLPRWLRWLPRVGAENAMELEPEVTEEVAPAAHRLASISICSE